jgi:1,4-alpha-glucan branching enzyme
MPLGTPTVSREEVEAVAAGDHGDPFAVLGPHRVPGGVAIRAFLPAAGRVEAVAGEARHPLRRIDERGFFEAVVPDRSQPFPYLLEVDGRLAHDPYAFGTVLSEDDLYLWNEGTLMRAYEALGAHPGELGGVRGVRFAVWAPNARRVSVVGDWNGWDARVHPMRRRGLSGVWEIFLPGLGPGALYKFDVGGSLRADPFAFAAELRPGTASVVWDLDAYRWGDEAWLRRRAEDRWRERPMSIYEVHLGSWRRVPEEGDRWLTYRELADRLAEHVRATGFTHVELLPVTEHPLDASWGYQTTGYFAPTRRHGTPDDFKYLVDRCHQSGIGVILDWAPAHFPRDRFALAEFDGTRLYEHADPRQGEHPDWGTLVFNYGRTEVREFLVASGLFWLDRYHVDGLRVDAVASMLYLDYSRPPGAWVPNRFGGRENVDAVETLRALNDRVRAEFPGVVTIAEESTSWPGVTRPAASGGLGFSLKWNMGWMHDTLRHLGRDPVHRRHHHDELTFSLWYAFDEAFVLPLSHDEVVHAKGSLLAKLAGDEWQRFATLRLLYAYMYGHPGKKLLFMGSELGSHREWSEARSLDWHLAAEPANAGLMRFVADLNRVYREQAALHEVDFSPAGFEWIDVHDAERSTLAFLRWAAGWREAVVVVCNFTPVPRHGHRVGVPGPGFYRELLNSDSHLYWGSNVGNAGGVQAEAVPAHGRSHSVRLTLPPLGALFLKCSS